ncbi:MAG: DUF2065 domain-containing protein [Thermomonas sp.]|uniref:DUF2065 domain-containing protein n=1 Tax=Thermomonas sp. TaxID=1971895 RepID=UPI001EBD01F0|nr:DUF2065 family protein [Thermomonas sp.]MBV2208909.1 DUF2065 domain-containing protein [Thermomonas sp.]
MSDLWAALCLVAIIEGLLLFAAPAAWKRTVEQMLALSDEQVRRFGGVILMLGLISLWLVRGS